jgi:serine protease AprX
MSSPDPPAAPIPGAVAPTLARLEADAFRTGRGITIAFLDAGFTAHPDIARRIAGFHAVEDPDAVLSATDAPRGWEWHGTQTSVVAAGDGALSDGIYRGLASDAKLLLVQVGREGSIHEEQIARAFEWLLENFERYGVRVVNVSLGGDVDLPLPESRVNLLVEEAVRRGLVVVAAAGNSGGSEHPNVVPPASAPSAVTVGGYHDWITSGENEHDHRHEFALYWSSFGDTADGLPKPELIAPALEVAAPIPVAAPELEAARTLSRLVSATDDELPGLIREWGPHVDLPAELADAPLGLIREAVEEKRRERKVVAAHYQHVDGTSFAAPIVSSIVAQMLEANPRLTPAEVKEILVRTALPIEGAPAPRQGFGVVRAKAAVEVAEASAHAPSPSGSA